MRDDDAPKRFVSLQNQTSSLGSFMPLLMGGGVFSALAQGAKMSPAAAPTQPADTVIVLQIQTSI